MNANQKQFKTVKLGDVCTVIAGQSPPSDTYNDDGIGLPFFQGKADFGERHPVVRKWCSNPVKIAEDRDILISVRAPVGPTNVATEACCIGRGLSAIRCGENVNMEYLLQFLRWFESRLEAQGKGATFKAITQKDLNAIVFPLPPIPEQKRIAEILDLADEARRNRRENLKLYDDLIRSLFLQTFGDPVSNPMGWDIESLAKFGSFKNGLNFGRGESGVKVRYLGVGDFKALAKIDDTQSLSQIALNDLPSEDYFLRNGDLVFVRSNGNKQLVGRCIAVYPNDEKVTYSGFCIRYRIETGGIDPVFLVHLFRMSSFKSQMLQGGRGANIQNINQQILNALEIPCPPISLQNEFAQQVEEITVQKEREQALYKQHDDLFNSLLQRAFKGDL